MYTGCTPEVHRMHKRSSGVHPVTSCTSGVPPVYTALEPLGQGGGAWAAPLGTPTCRVMP